MQMEDMLQVLSAMMSNNEKSAKPENQDESHQPNEESSFFDGLNFDMLGKMGELFSHINKPDRNAELLHALKPHLRDENQHKVDTAVKISRMISLFPFIKDSGILNDLF
jgi:hypothetical protein